MGAAGIREAYLAYGTLAYQGFRSPSWTPGVFLRLGDGRWCLHFGRGQSPVLFDRLRIGAGMSFASATAARS